MTNISTEDIKKIRDKTGAGFMDCKKALEESNLDIPKALDWLRKKGISSAEKKSSRTASDGLIAIEHNNNEACIIEINSETDFVARNSDFHNFVGEVSKLNLRLKGNIDQIINANYNNSNEKVSNVLINLISKIGEKITIRRAKYIASNNGFVGTYIHNLVTKNMGKIGVIVSINTNVDRDKIDDFLKKISMHIAASNPLSLSIEKLDKNIIKKEKEIQFEQIKKDNKDQSILNKIIEGKMSKFFNDVVLLEQNFVVDDKIKIKDFILKTSKELNCKLEVNDFIRFKVGEEIE